MNDILYWLWLSDAFGAGARIGDIISYFGSAKELFYAGEEAWQESMLFGNTLINPRPRRISNMLNTSIDSAKRTMEYCNKNGIGILTPEDEQYPKRLLSVNTYPAVLFYRGDPSCLQSNHQFAAIGTREPSDYGKNACKIIVGDLVDNGAVIISGGALGIDSVAHKSAVDRNKPTVLVMGAGLDGGYLKKNEELRKSIEKYGCIISEYKPLSPAKPGSFPLRNRIVASLADAVAVFEAGAKSGTLNTCKHATKLGKPIFVLPGAIDSPLYFGSNSLLDDGAIPLFSAKSIFKYFGKDVEKIHMLPAREVPFSGIDYINETEEFKYGISKTHRMQKAEQKKREDESKKTAENNKIKKEVSKNETSNSNSDEKEKTDDNLSSALDDLSGTAKLIYQVMKSGFLTVDEIVRETKLQSFKVLRGMTELQMSGLVDKDNSLKYKIL